MMEGQDGQEFHSSEVLEHCRVCGDSLVKQRVTYPCKAHQGSLLHAFTIDVRADQQDTHPPRFCNRCFAKVKKNSLTSSLAPFEWTPHTDSGCTVRIQKINQQQTMYLLNI